MNCTRGAFIVSSFHSPPHHHRPPDTRKHTCLTTSTCHFSSFNNNHIRLGDGLLLLRKRTGTKICADVKSEPYDITGSTPDSIRFKDDKKDDNEIEGELGRDVLWWEEFPKRWVIVILCFSAFLLCNMDRVSQMRVLTLWSPNYTRVVRGRTLQNVLFCKRGFVCGTFEYNWDSIKILCIFFYTFVLCWLF